MHGQRDGTVSEDSSHAAVILVDHPVHTLIRSTKQSQHTVHKSAHLTLNLIVPQTSLDITLRGRDMFHVARAVERSGAFR